MTEDERIAQITAKIDRARVHSHSVKLAIDAYFATQPYTVSARRDPNTRRPIYFVQSMRSAPPELSVLIGDTIHNLRTALEHLAFHLVWVNQKKMPEKGVSFPIAKDLNKYEELRNRSLRLASRSAVLAVDALKPYADGNPLLWQLHMLDVVDKHRLLLTAGSQFDSVDIGTGFTSEHFRKMYEDGAEDSADWATVALPSMELFLRPADRLFPLRPLDELFIDAPDAEIVSKKFAFTVAVGESGLAYGESVVELLTSMIAKVEEIVQSFRGHLA